uniref:Uncharacterized protein n=1 Tax=Lotharella globosa TaxID=91324 RepID=A0A7S3ZD26_9EUKA
MNEELVYLKHDVESTVTSMVEACLTAIDSKQGPLLSTLVGEFSALKEARTVPFLKWNIEAIPREHRENIQNLVAEIETTELYKMVHAAMEKKDWCRAHPSACVKECEEQRFSMNKAHLLTVLLLTVVPKISPQMTAFLNPWFEFDLLPGLVQTEVASLRMGWEGMCEIAETMGFCCGPNFGLPDLRSNAT